MKLFNRENLAKDVRSIIVQAYGTVQRYADEHGKDVNDIRRAYSLTRHNPHNIKGRGNIIQLLNLVDTLKDYEIVYTIRRRK